MPNLHPRLQWLALAVAATAGLAWGADTLLAARAEAHISDLIPADTTPRVSIAGFPFVTSALQEGVAHIQVSLIDTDTSLGPVNVTTTAHDVQGPTDSLLDGRLDGLVGYTVSRSATIDAAALGRLLGMPDMDISNPTDISPGAAPLPQAQLRGTPPGCTEPVTVLADLRVRDHIVSIEPATTPSCGAAAFRWSAPADTLPVVGTANSLWVRGGSLFLDSGINTPTPLSPELFTP
ncbi:LmeA family phospholipid-binding protein [Corynebacterium sp. 13CS0277]|uniref:LmeA family phospholipid-binding protein n=1 Tax=Corynebacterium sp. 13CS0277 TaxID=2071994 RepID=UPI001304DE6A|nr:LmeA family phospholipid-binding protein [Corynebacterium sp. 13CS0277]